MTSENNVLGRSSIALALCAASAVACSSTDSPPPTGTIAGGGTTASAGASANSAGHTAAGGSSGAANSAGGVSTGGVSSGGSAAGSVSTGGSIAGGTTGGNSAGGASAGTAGALSTGGTGGGSAGAAGAPSAPGSNGCTVLPTSLLLSDFSPATFKGVTDGQSWSANRDTLWGGTDSLTGGDIFYQGTAASAPTVTLHNETLTISATIAPGDYMGYMFNFGPKCSDARVTQGLAFDVVGTSTLGLATLKVQMQERSDYPSTANPTTRPGDCVPTSAANQWNDCLSPVTTVIGSGSEPSPGTLQLPWSGFSGGSPMSTLDNTQLMAIQWQFECPPTGGTISAGATGTLGAADTVGGAGNPGDAGGGAGTSVAGTAGTGSGGIAGTDAGGGGSGGAATGGDTATSGTGGAAAGSAGSAGTAGAGSSLPPCVVSFTIDNVTFY